MTLEEIANAIDKLIELQTELTALKEENENLRIKTSVSLGVGDGQGNLFVHGDYDSIKAVQAKIFELEKLRARLAEIEGQEPEPYDAGRLNDYGGGNVGWWHEYIRSELERAHEHYAEQFNARITEEDAQLLRSSDRSSAGGSSGGRVASRRRESAPDIRQTARGER